MISVLDACLQEGDNDDCREPHESALHASHPAERSNDGQNDRDPEVPMSQLITSLCGEQYHHGKALQKDGTLRCGNRSGDGVRQRAHTFQERD